MKEISLEDYMVRLSEEGICTISRTYFSDILDYARYRMLGGDVKIRISNSNLNLEKVILTIDEEKRIDIRGEVNYLLSGFLDRKK